MYPEHSVTVFILSHLKPRKRENRRHGLRERIKGLPSEIRIMIRDHASGTFGRKPRHEPSAEVTRYSPENEPDFWLKEFKGIPWLWDLDTEMCKEKDQQLPATGQTLWDWELLLLELALDNVFEPGGLMHKGVPPGLRNRRRIWRMLHELGVPASPVAVSPQAAATSNTVTTTTQLGAPINDVAASTQAGAPVNTVGASTQAGAPIDAVVASTQAGAPVNTVAPTTQAGEAVSDGEAS